MNVIRRKTNSDNQECIVQRSDVLSISGIRYFTNYVSRVMTSLQVEVDSLCPGQSFPENIYEVGLLLFDKFAVFGHTWPFVVCLREARTMVFMSNPGGLTPMLLLGLEEHEGSNSILTAGSEINVWPGEDILPGNHGSVPGKRRKRICSILLWIFKVPHVGVKFRRKFHAFRRRKN